MRTLGFTFHLLLASSLAAQLGACEDQAGATPPTSDTDAGEATDAAAALDASVLDAGGDASGQPDSDGGTPDPDGGEEPEPSVPTVRFVALGDAGEGNEKQHRVGATIARVCAELGCDFALYLGDNIYNSGVDSVDDEQFETKFERPYEALAFPFYVALGNHDYGADGAGWEWHKADYQVEYTQKSTKWTLPSHYYRFVREHVTFLALDTNALFWNRGFDDQKAWFDREVSEATTPWKIAFGHHEYVSNGRHGNAGSYDDLPWVPLVNGEHVKRFVESSICERVDVYFAGHDHDRQWLAPVCGVQFIVSGAGAKTRALQNRGNETYFEDGSRPGFLWVEIAGDVLTGRFYDMDGTLSFEHMIVRPSR